VANDSQTIIQDQIVVEGGVVFLASTLEICSAHTLDSGAYSCFAENRVGTDVFDFEVDIHIGGKLLVNWAPLIHFICKDGYSKY